MYLRKNLLIIGIKSSESIKVKIDPTTYLDTYAYYYLTSIQIKD